ncbi:hypothetical protein BGW38_002930 [Lunasporangiospora selenospora]|uniref:Adhesin domain-containing protein n=1 Tax=Lunasporangiospora selenospora TaxID=979761 RepID=A0A9P6G1F8_9FUNG|nr:hypothetical protein BGW38_002930 [Lunasporangiospora selenospora]
MGENQPLLDNPSGLPLAPQCARGIGCMRCVTGKHENSRKRVFMRRASIAIVLACIYWFVFDPMHRRGIVSRGHGHSNDFCRDHLVEWDGPSEIVTSSTNLGINITRGNIAGSVKVLTADVTEPTITVHAQVSWNVDKSRGGDYQHGLHMKVIDTRGHMSLTLGTDQDRIIDGHGKRFCGRYEIQVLLPKSFSHFGHLVVEGVVMELDASDLSKITFESAQFVSVTGNIKVSDLLQTKGLAVDVISGSASFERVTSPTGSSLDVRVNAVAGSVDLNAEVPVIDSDNDQSTPGHKVVISTTSGDIDLVLRPAASAFGKVRKNQTPGDIHLSAISTAGRVSTKVELVENQALFLDGSSVAGVIDAVVSDRFVGDIKLSNTMGSVSVKEAENSSTIIDYTSNKRNYREGKKHLKDGGQEGKSGSISLSSVVGRVNLSFD